MHYYCYRTLTPSAERHRESVARTKPARTGCRGNVPGGSKSNFMLIIYSHCSTYSENLAKIGPVDVEKIGVNLAIIRLKIRNSSKTIYSLPCMLLRSSARAG